MRKARVYILIVVVFTSSIALGAEIRLSMEAEFFNFLQSGADLEDWKYFQSGSAGLAFRNMGSRNIRGELSVDLVESGGIAAPTGEAPAAIDLRRLYIRPAFGDVLVSLGKTRSTWGAGYLFNSGDVIFGSESTDVLLYSQE
ncbi:MAG TPA: hypothetical protein ENN41_10450, partial [Sediminispirochaeta sp.]|nr:hypothetical protein [Sediminispirochaeta sp.]